MYKYEYYKPTTLSCVLWHFVSQFVLFHPFIISQYVTKDIVFPDTLNIPEHFSRVAIINMTSPRKCSTGTCVYGMCNTCFVSIKKTITISILSGRCYEYLAMCRYMLRYDYRPVSLDAI